MDALTLPPILDLAAAAPLQTSLLARRGQNLALDASEVQRIGGQCLQVLLSARRSWREEGRDLLLRAPSAACAEALTLMQAGTLLGAEE